MQRGLMGPILIPHSLPPFREDGEIRAGGASGKRKREKERMDKRKTKRPEAPLNGPGRGGRVGASATQHLVQHLVRDSTRDEDVSSLRLLSPPDWILFHPSRRVQIENVQWRAVGWLTTVFCHYSAQQRYLSPCTNHWSCVIFVAGKAQGWTWRCLGFMLIQIRGLGHC